MCSCSLATNLSACLLRCCCLLELYYSQLNNKYKELNTQLREKKVCDHDAMLLYSQLIMHACWYLQCQVAWNKAYILSIVQMGKQKLLEDLEDASNELVIAEEDEIRYVVGEVFVRLSADDAESRLQAYQEDTQAEVKRLGSELDDIRARMDELKRVLYAKLGSNINLEEE